MPWVLNQSVVAGLSVDPVANLESGLTLLSKATHVDRVLDTRRVDSRLVFSCQFKVRDRPLFGRVPREWVDLTDESGSILRTGADRCDAPNESGDPVEGLPGED